MFRVFGYLKNIMEEHGKLCEMRVGGWWIVCGVIVLHLNLN